MCTNRARLLCCVLSALLIGAHATVPAQARLDARSTSESWAGYILTMHSRGRFGRIAGDWTEPPASCDAGRPSSALFWVGFGGYEQHSLQMEQIGTYAECDAAAAPSYGAWLELPPAPEVRIKMRIRPGDAISASVDVSGQRAYFVIRDHTTGRHYARRFSVRRPDTATAEWIVEAPLECERQSCVVDPLTDFGTVTFSELRASGANGRAGGISDPAWNAIESEIRGAPEARGPSGEALSVDAAPQLAATQESFSVTWNVLSSIYE